MSIQEYETTEKLEMVFLYNLGLPHEVDKENPYRVKMIFKGDLEFIKAKLEDFWSGNTRVDAWKYSNDWQTITRLLWIGEKYNPNFSRNKSVVNNQEKTIKKVHQ